MNDQEIDNTEDLQNAADLPELTERQFGFIKSLCEGKTAKQAYKDNYNVDNCQDSTIGNLAYRLKQTPVIKAWLAAIKREQLTEATYTKTEHLKELDELIQEAKAVGNYGAAVTAMINKGKAAGHYQDKPVQQGEITGADALFSWITERTAQLESENDTKH